jgi:hypothetical protein
LASTQGRLTTTSANSGVDALTCSPCCRRKFTTTPSTGARTVVRARSSAARSRAAVLSRTMGCWSAGNCGSPFSAVSTRCSFSRTVVTRSAAARASFSDSSRLLTEATPLIASSSWRCDWRRK